MSENKGLSEFAGGPGQVQINLGEPIMHLSQQAHRLYVQLQTALDGGETPARQLQLLTSWQAYQRAIAVLRGEFTADGEELVDTDLPQVLSPSSLSTAAQTQEPGQ